MKRVIIFSDSLGRPRPDLSVTDRTVYSDVYGKKLEQLLGAEYDVEICYVESLDTDDGIFWAERMVAFREPDIVVFQIGINDCAPRIFSKKSSCIILKPWFRKLTHDFFLRVIGFFRPHITRCMKKVYVHVNKYKTNYEKMMVDIRKYSPHCMFYCISIAKGDNYYVSKSPDINKNISEYNLVLKKLFLENYIDVNALKVDKLHISDGVHLTKEAHTKLAEEIYYHIKKDSKKGRI